MGINKYYIADVLNKTGVRVKYKSSINNKTIKEFTLEPNDIDHPTSTYIRSSDYFTAGDLMPLTPTAVNESNGIKLSINKDGVPNLLVFRKDDDSIGLGEAMHGGDWAVVSGQKITSGLSDNKRLIMQLEIVDDKCKIEIWPDTPLQPSGGYVTTAQWPRALAQIGEVIKAIFRPP